MLDLDTQFRLVGSDTVSVSRQIDEGLKYDPNLIMVVTATSSQSNGDL